MNSASDVVAPLKNSGDAEQNNACICTRQESLWWNIL